MPAAGWPAWLSRLQALYAVGGPPAEGWPLWELTNDFISDIELYSHFSMGDACISILQNELSS
jgi:hypothetical protein